MSATSPGFAIRSRSTAHSPSAMASTAGASSAQCAVLPMLSVREENEKYLADRFPDGGFAILVRVPVVTNETLSPDLQNPDALLYEWIPKDAQR